ncbi:MAG: hypothetical protein ACRCX2_00355 [Paraclostridium sp.]
MENFITPEKKCKKTKTKNIDIIPEGFKSQEDFLKSISLINGKPWYRYDFSDLDVISLFENEKK